MDRVFDTIKEAYQSLWQVKNYGQTLEIVTPVATINDMFVSVFVTKRGDDYVVTDGGWIDDGMYECEVPWSQKNYSKIGNFFLDNMNIQITQAQGKNYYYKRIDRLELLPNIVFDLANFINAIISTSNIQFVPDRTDLTFRKTARGYLRREFGEDKFEFDKTIGDKVSIRFNAVNKSNNGLNIINFVSGSTSNYYTNSICRSNMNFQMVLPFKDEYHINSTITLLDDTKKSVIESPQVQTYLDYLKEKSFGNNRLVMWSQQEELVAALA